MSKLSFLFIVPLFLSAIPQSAIAKEITPIDLVFNAYQGYFLEEGISSGSTFIQKVSLGQIDAKTLVQSAIKKQRLSPEAIKDSQYLNKVEAALFKIERRR